MKVEVSGMASSTGFEIFDVFGGSIKSKNYKKNELKDPILPLLIALCMVPFGLLFPVYSGELTGPERVYGFLIFWGLWVAFCFLFHYLLYCFFLDSALKRWHGCEHKAIDLIGRKKEVSLENLRKASRVSFTCGTTRLLSRVLPPLIVVFLMVLAISGLIGVKMVFIGLITIPIPAAFGISYLFQKFVVTARPTEEQLKDTLDVVELYTELRKQDEEFARKLKERGWGWQNEDYQE